MTEEFLHYIWKHSLFQKEHFHTTSREKIQVVEVGKHNHDAGPDFFDARIKIDDTLWAGNVEIHLRSSDWNRHGHQNDAVYKNVILHVVGEFDEEIQTVEGREVPCALLQFPETLLKQYQNLRANHKWISCEEELTGVEKFFVNSWLDRVLVERLERKVGEIKSLLQSNKNFWEETFYQYLTRHFGMKVNAEPFEQLARSLPVKYLARQKDSLQGLEALLFGQAGFLENPAKGDEYFMRLKKEYQLLKKKYNLKPMEPLQWKFLRLRPPNFPTLRIAQLAALVYQSHSLFSRILDTDNPDELRDLLRAKASTYWDTHYQFNKPATRKTAKTMGKATLDNLLINVIIPFLFVYGKIKNDNNYCDRALLFLDKIKPERNAVITNWKKLGVETRSAYFTQALLQLKEAYCNPKRCLECELGNRIMRINL